MEWEHGGYMPPHEFHFVCANFSIDGRLTTVYQDASDTTRVISWDPPKSKTVGGRPKALSAAGASAGALAGSCPSYPERRGFRWRTGNPVGNPRDQLAVAVKVFAQRGNLVSDCRLSSTILSCQTRLEKLVLADHSPRRLNERHQHVEGGRRALLAGRRPRSRNG